MSKKKIVSIEDRIPKLKEQRKKKANRRLVTYLAIFFVLVLMIVYLQTPLSDIKTIEVTGHNQIDKDAVITLSGLSTDTNIWSVDKTEVKQALQSNPVVQTAEVGRDFPSTISIHIDEYERVGYLSQTDGYHPLLESGEMLDEVTKQPEGDAPLLIDFDDEKKVEQMSSELNDLPGNIRHLISEIHWTPESDNPYKITLYMVDGFVVDGTIRNFSERMSAYPSIVSQLDQNEKGIVHIGVGAYFESFEKNSETSDEANEDTSSESND